MNTLHIKEKKGYGKTDNLYIKQAALERGFIDENVILRKLGEHVHPDAGYIRSILRKSLAIETLSPDETAALINVSSPGLWEEIFETAARVKKKVYDNRIVTFAPLYLSNLCVNDCVYCGFRKSNPVVRRKTLTIPEIKKETEVLAGRIGHKRLITVYGEHPKSGINYITESIKAIYSVNVKKKNGISAIRRINVNAAPMSARELRELKKAGIGTFQVFQETYHRPTYALVHPAGTIKADYTRRLYCMHRAMEAGIDDVGLGVLFGLYDWRFEIMGLLYHAIELENKFGVGPHTVSFPRLEPAINTPFIARSKYGVSDGDLKKIVSVIRLAIPYTGMILTAREPAGIRRGLIGTGVTQTDASSKIGIGSYGDNDVGENNRREQFVLGDTRSLDEVIRELAEMGYITSFCTAGYRCGRTGKNIMNLLRSGKEGKFCKLNAILTFREWLDDFASERTRAVAKPLIEREISEIRNKAPELEGMFHKYYKRIAGGERDLYI